MLQCVAVSCSELQYLSFESKLKFSLRGRESRVRVRDLTFSGLAR